MNQELSFEAIPFEIEPDYRSEVFEEESERGRRRSLGRGGGRYSQLRSLSRLRSKRTKRPPIAKSRPIAKGRRRKPWDIVREPYDIGNEPYLTEPEPLGSERERWLQDCLNQTIGTQLRVSGIIGSETRRAIQNFQRQQGLRVTGIAGPDTEEALKDACKTRGRQLLPDEMEFGAHDESEWQEMELRAGFRANYNALLRHMLPADRGLWATRRCFRLSQYDRAPRQRGVYLLIFLNRTPSGQVGYVGEAENLFERMQGYRRDVFALGLNSENYAFCWVLTAQHKSIERGLRVTLNPTGLVTNQRELEIALESPFSEAEEIELAAELLAISNEEELDQFLGKLFKRIGRGIKNAGRFIGKRVLPVLGKGLKALGKVALPVVGKALGSFIPIPGVGTAIGGALGTALSKALELEFSGLSEGEIDLEMARRFVRIAGTAASQAVLADPYADPQAAANAALMSAARRHVPNLPVRVASGAMGMDNSARYAHTGRWTQRGNRIAVLDV